MSKKKKKLWQGKVYIQINFKIKQTTPLFKIRSMQSLLQGKMFNSIGKNIFLIFYLSKISFKKVKIK